MSTRKKKKSGGRTTPKGTQPPEKKGKDAGDHSGPEVSAGPTQAELAGKVGRSKQRAFRPISHNRGNR